MAVRSLALRPQTWWLDNGSRVSREVYARFCERRGVRFPPPTLLVVMCGSREQAEGVKERLAAWLAPRGLAFNEAKTRVVRLEDGFKFLGMHIRRYRNGKLLIKPSKAAAQRIRKRLTTEMRALRGAHALAVVTRLNPIIRGWSAYYRSVVSKKTFVHLDTHMWKLARSWAKRRHPNKSGRWVIDRYFGAFHPTRRDRWIFGDHDSGAYLTKFAWTKIVRHQVVKGWASPDDPTLVDYWAQRRRRRKPPLDQSRLRLLQTQCHLAWSDLVRRVVRCGTLSAGMILRRDVGC